MTMTTEADAATGGELAAAKAFQKEPIKEGTASMKKKEKKMTKRQKRKQVNETNKWPQHPKIQDMEIRNKAYVRVAGLGASTKKKETIDPKLDLMSPEVKFGRLLGSTDQRKRHIAVQKLKTYLKARCDIHNENGGISEMDLLKLWKGLWYTLYMADKVPVQDELSKNLSELLWCVAGTEEEDEYAGEVYMEMCEEEDNDQDDEDDDEDPEVTLEEVVNTLYEEEDDEDEENQGDIDEDDSETESKDMDLDQDGQEVDEEEEDELDDSEIPHCRGAHLASLFIRTFFRTIRREWGNMDKYRVDKFYTLARMYMHEIFKYMASRQWNLGIIRLFNDALFDEVLNQKPNGLRYHLIDIVLDELAKVNAKSAKPLTEATFLDTMEPFFAMCQTGAGGDDTVQMRVVENVLEKFLNKYSVVSDTFTGEGEADDKAKELIFEDVHVGTIAEIIFELASDPETRDNYRKSLYEMHKCYMRRLKKVGKDVPLNEQEGKTHGCCHSGHETNDGCELSGEMVEHSQSDEEENDHEDDKEIETPSKVEKKRKRKEGQVDFEQVENAKEEARTEPKRKRNKKKKGQKSAKEVVTKIDEHVEEEVVTISLSDQKKAKVRGKKAAEPEVEELTAPDSADKRVKWLPTNKSKSYKASIKGLRTAQPPKTSQVTPEKSILLNKGQVRRAGATRKAGRKKAVNYFRFA